MILVVPDIHEQPEKLALLQPLFDQASRVIFIGDWFDSFDMGSDTKGTIRLLKQYLEDPKYDFCLGNHDCQYFFINRGFRCSGFRPITLGLIRAEISDAEIERFKLFHRIGNTVISHAGYHPHYLGADKDGGSYDFPSEEEAKRAVDLAIGGQFHRLFNPGYPVGGIGIGGPTWLRPEEWEPVGFTQIVGHTPMGKEPRIEEFDNGGKVYFLDTHLKHVMWLEDDGTPSTIIDLIEV